MTQLVLEPAFNLNVLPQSAIDSFQIKALGGVTALPLLTMQQTTLSALAQGKGAAVEILCTRNMDVATPKLMQLSLSGELIAQGQDCFATLRLFEVTEKNEANTLLKIQLRDARIVNHQIQVSPQGTPVEQFGLRATEVMWEVTDFLTGDLLRRQGAGWSLASGQAIARFTSEHLSVTPAL